MPRSPIMPMVRVDQQVDTCGEGYPTPLIELIRAMQAAPMGSTLEVLTSDPGATRDILTLIQQAGCEYLGAYAMDGYTSVLVCKTREIET